MAGLQMALQVYSASRYRYKDNLMISTKNLFIVYTLKVLRREISLICHKKEESGDVLSKTWMMAVANR